MVSLFRPTQYKDHFLLVLRVILLDELHSFDDIEYLYITRI